MKFDSWRSGSMLSLFAAAALFVSGCGQADNKSGHAKGKSSHVAQAKKGNDKKADDHSSWWCTEHGIPEDICSMCSDKVAATFKKKCDWCDKHDRAQSQCFICDPKLQDKFAALYRAKYGKEPPPIEEDEKDDKSKKEEKKG